MSNDWCSSAGISRWLVAQRGSSDPRLKRRFCRFQRASAQDPAIPGEHTTDDGFGCVSFELGTYAANGYWQ
jgi:hypothetical protein